ncbi:radical SAM protein [Herbivorax sp. ANBcel31]|uniref:radical SAM protein n=1 Tax=Herbivorax sp. ANBcel31 TaxID=3069754 RepID=UPI0027B2BBE3|nr:radical SAM/SPASM domain-containing protein [Herbivorax sp. ANBcel31]MDQ2086180.1 radical SAM protein [Herbivorax sp. ANBcel31]
MSELFRPTAQLKISITPECNNDCAICLNKTTRTGNKNKRILSEGKIRQLVDEGANLGMVGTYWTGGEPLIEYKNLLKLIEYSTKRGMIPTIVTNGGMIGAYGNYRELNKELLKKASLYDIDTPDIVRSLKKAGLERVYFSVDNSHNTLESPNSRVSNCVPSELVAKSIRSFLKEGFGSIHKLDAIGHQLRITATSSGMWHKPTNNIIQDVINKSGVGLKKLLTSNSSIYENKEGQILLKRLGISNVGKASTLGDNVLENKSGKNLFEICCNHFTPTNKAYDGGKYHRDLFIDWNGIVYTCGNHAYSIGNVFNESLSSIIEGVNKPKLDSEFAINRKVFHSLLVLSQNKRIGSNAIGEAFRLISLKNPELIKDIKTQCGACNCLGNNKQLQREFLKALDDNSVLH